MTISAPDALRPVHPADLEPLIDQLSAISGQAQDLQRRIALLQAGLPMIRPGWPMQRVTPIMPQPLDEDPVETPAQEQAFFLGGEGCAEPDDLLPAEAHRLVRRVAGDLAGICRKALPDMPGRAWRDGGRAVLPPSQAGYFDAARLSI